MAILHPSKRPYPRSFVARKRPFLDGRLRKRTDRSPIDCSPWVKLDASEWTRLLAPQRPVIMRYGSPLPSWFFEAVEILCERCPEPSFDNIKIPDQSYVRYHSVLGGTLPSNFIAVGDSNLQLNPVYGQGFAKAILNAITLNSLLHSLDSGVQTLPQDFSARYFKTNASRTGGLWDATRLHDYGALTCEPMTGESRDTGRLVRWFELKLITAATKYKDVAAALWRVRHLIAAENALLTPTILWKVLWTGSQF
ncbi:hypothetical protein B0H14DRAFT_3716327 [Mycena olivaceomarginata]|nr:hypothetical protein B0H14DRAFT_3716327 [Mycena olivaceomarginata]